MFPHTGARAHGQPHTCRPGMIHFFLSSTCLFCENPSCHFLLHAIGLGNVLKETAASFCLACIRMCNTHARGCRKAESLMFVLRHQGDR